MNKNLPSAVFVALMLVGPSKCLKQIIQIELNRVKSPNLAEANQLQAWSRIWNRDYWEQTQLSSGQSGTWTRDLRIPSPAL